MVQFFVEIYISTRPNLEIYIFQHFSLLIHLLFHVLLFLFSPNISALFFTTLAAYLRASDQGQLSVFEEIKSPRHSNLHKMLGNWIIVRTRI